MDYFKIYDSLMRRSLNRNLEGYSEKHHIVPKCIGGTDVSENIVKLTAKEHYIAHRLLIEMYPSEKKLKYAFWMMCTMKTESQDRYKVSSRTYEYAKLLISTKSESTKKKISDSLKYAYESGSRKKRTGIKMPESFGEAISNAKKGMVGTNKGIPMSDEQKEKIRNTLKGHNVSEVTRNKISETLLSRPMLTCPYCNRQSRGTCFPKHHFENCKHKQ